MTRAISKSNRPFNLPVELGLRSLFVCAALHPEELDLQKLSYLDYLLVHSGDVTRGPVSLHAPVPNRGGEWLVKRQVLESGLNLMIERELLAKHFNESGISYAATDLTEPFLAHLSSEYALQLKQRASWISSKFGSMPIGELEQFMVTHLQKWGSEYKFESMFRGIGDD
jgi:hypothetical protein